MAGTLVLTGKTKGLEKLLLAVISVIFGKSGVLKALYPVFDTTVWAGYRRGRKPYADKGLKHRVAIIKLTLNNSALIRLLDRPTERDTPY